MDVRLIEKFKKWDGFPHRSIKWIQHTFPMEVNVKYTLTESDSNSEPQKRGFVQILKANKKQYWQFLKDNKIQPDLYERTLGNYNDWLQNDAK